MFSDFFGCAIDVVIDDQCPVSVNSNVVMSQLPQAFLFSFSTITIFTVIFWGQPGFVCIKHTS